MLLTLRLACSVGDPEPVKKQLCFLQELGTDLALERVAWRQQSYLHGG